MKGTRTLVTICFLTMLVALTWGFVVGEFWREGAIIVGMPWGIISIIDVYTGGALFCGWIAWRERSAARVAVWVVLIFVLGHLATSAYALLALTASRGDAERFWMGRHGRTR